jgi:hypothetical protein
LPPDVGLDRVEGRDALQRLLGDGAGNPPLLLVYLPEGSPRVCPAQRLLDATARIDPSVAGGMWCTTYRRSCGARRYVVLTASQRDAPLVDDGLPAHISSDAVRCYNPRKKSISAGVLRVRGRG